MDPLDFVLPAGLGDSPRRHRGRERETIFLVATGPGHPAADEQAVLAVLGHVHAEIALEWLFESLDGAQKSGYVHVDEREIDLAPYRAYSDPKITEGIARHMVESGMGSAAIGFGIFCRPAVRLQAFDEWRAWAGCRDALRRLSAAAGRMEAFGSLLAPLLAGTPAADEAFGRLTDLLRLAWSGSDWETWEPRLPTLDPGRVLAGIGGPPGVVDPAVQFLARLRDHACDFYRDSLARISSLVSKSLAVLRRSGATVGALVVGVPWIDRAAELLTERGVSFVVLHPRTVRMAPMLDLSGVLLDELGEDRRKLGDLFSGKRVRSQVDALLDRPRERRESWAGDWSVAGQALYLARSYSAAEECVARAVEIEPGVAHPWAVWGGICCERSRWEQGCAHFRRAAALEPRTASHWEGLGVALDGLGRKRQARRALARSIYLQPGNGALWCRMGLVLHGHGRLRRACFCFTRGEALGDPKSAHNREIVCRKAPRTLDCPPELLPLVLPLLRRFPRLFAPIFGRG